MYSESKNKAFSTTTYYTLLVKENIMNNNQQELFTELNPSEGAAISGGGLEVFTLKNKTKYNITYYLDGKKWLHKPGQTWIWSTKKGGTISFDTDGRSNYKEIQKYNLSDGRVYEFQNNNYTPGNPYDLDLYKVA